MPADLRADVKGRGRMQGVFFRALSRLLRYLGLQIYRVNVRPLIKRLPEARLPGGITVRIVSPAELLKATADPQLDLPRDFVGDALARGDMAFGAFEGGRLVGYTWRTFTRAPEFDGRWIKVKRPYQYSYRAYTRPSHRGKHVHVAITRLADSYLLDRGYAAEVGFIDITNFVSCGVAAFMGRRKVGYAGHLKLFGRSVLFRTPGVRRIGVQLFELEQPAQIVRDPEGAGRLIEEGPRERA